MDRATTKDKTMTMIKKECKGCDFWDPSESRCHASICVFPDSPKKETIKELLEVVEAMRDWIDAVPSDIVLPAMPGFDRDWADCVIDEAKKEAE